ncbi:MAG: hypothetical protein ACJKSS_00345 [Patescibacteria group bacterium UBA2103]
MTELLRIKDLSEEDKKEYYRIKNQLDTQHSSVFDGLKERLRAIQHIQPYNNRKWTLYFQDSIIRWMMFSKNPDLIEWPAII